ALASRDAVQHVRARLRGPAAGDHRPEDWKRPPVRRACPRARCHGHGLRPQRDSVRRWRLQPRSGHLRVHSLLRPHLQLTSPGQKEDRGITRIGSTGAPQLFMDLPFDHHGNMLGVTTPVNTSGVPAILYRIDPATGKATKLFNLVGSNYVMGLAFGRDGKLYATDDFENPVPIGSAPGLVLRLRSRPCPLAFQAVS